MVVVETARGLSRVFEGAARGTEVAVAIMRYGVEDMIVAKPESPEGARERGMVVAGIIRKVVPECSVVEKCVGAGGGGLRIVVKSPWPELGGGGLWSGVGVGFGHAFEGEVTGGFAVSRPPGAGVATTSGSTYTVASLVSPPPAGIATVDGKGPFGVGPVRSPHIPRIIEGPPGKHDSSPGY